MSAGSQPTDHRVQLITTELFEGVLGQARRSPRRRMNHNFHAGPDDNPHRFLNVMLHGTYVTPHRHTSPPKPESFLVLEGQLAFFLFDDAGQVMARHLLGRGPAGVLGIDVAPGLWHSMAVVTPYAVCLEVKPGPYSAATDKDFAPWAPREGAPEAPVYLESLLRSAGF